MKVQPKLSNQSVMNKTAKLIVFISQYLYNTAKHFQTILAEINNSIITFLCMILNKFILMNNPYWFIQFTESERQTLENWNDCRNIQLKLFLIYLALPYLYFDEDSFITQLSITDISIAYLNLMFANLIGFLGLLLTLSAIYYQPQQGIWTMIGFGVILMGMAIGILISNAEKYAVLFIQKITSKLDLY